MMKREKILEALDDFMFFNEGDYITREMEESKEIVLEYVEHLEKMTATFGAECSRHIAKISKVKRWINKVINDQNTVVCSLSDLQRLLDILEE